MEMENKNILLSEENLRSASASVRKALLASLPDPAECDYDFSPEFNSKMHILLNSFRRKKAFSNIVKNIAAVLALILIGFSIWVSTDTEASAEFKRWVRTIYKDSVVYEFFGNTDHKQLPEYSFGWLPDGYEIADYEQLSNMTSVMVSNKNNDIIDLTYMYVNRGSEVAVIGENMINEDTTVKDIHADFYYAPNAGSPSVLVWAEGDIIFSINSSLDKETLIRIAENIQK